MTPEETEKRLHKRELNRVAARKCRNKRKLQHESVKTVSGTPFGMVYMDRQVNTYIWLILVR